jgi:hypothetical protein
VPRGEDRSEASLLQRVELTHEKCPRNGFVASSKDVLEGSTLLPESAGGVQWAFRWRREER